MSFKASSYAVPGNFEYITQVAQDWEKPPFVEIRVRDVNWGCNPEWDLIFTRKWGGIKDECLKSTKSGKSRKCTLRVEAVDPITMRDLGGIIVCGKRGGKPFIEAIRPNSEGVCPDLLHPVQAPHQ